MSRLPQKIIFCFCLLAIGTMIGCRSEPNDFMQAIQDGNDSAAFALLNENLQDEFGDEGGFSAWAETKRPVSWAFGSKCSANLNSARANGSGRLANEDRFLITIHSTKVGEAWLIEGIEYSVPSAGGSELWGRSSQLDCSD